MVARPVQHCRLFNVAVPSVRAEKECRDAGDRRKCLHCTHREVDFEEKGGEECD